MDQVIQGVSRLEGVIRPPGDKSISHRAAIFNAFAQGTATVRNYSPGADCRSTLGCLRRLGVRIKSLTQKDGADQSFGFTITGGELQEPTDVLNAGNSGTTMRLLAGVLAAQPFVSIITGDASLRSRPMDRVAHPLRLMGADIRGRKGASLAPLVIQGGRLRGIEYTLPVASAQVKSALLLAGLLAQGETVVHQPAMSRDHTERMLLAMGAPVRTNGLTVSIQTGQLTAMDITLPGDISAAAFWLVAGVAHPQARIRLMGVGVNPTRTGILDALKAMGARITLERCRTRRGEPVADLIAESSELRAIEVGGELVPRLIDEVPAVALAACFAKGTTVIRDAAELRVKESDRIRTTVQELQRLGADIRELPDGMVIRGTGMLRGAVCRSHGDHRLAMALGVAGLLARGQTVIRGAKAAVVSYPSFWDHLLSVAAGQRFGSLTDR